MPSWQPHTPQGPLVPGWQLPAPQAPRASAAPVPLTPCPSMPGWQPRPPQGPPVPGWLLCAPPQGSPVPLEASSPPGPPVPSWQPCPAQGPPVPGWPLCAPRGSQSLLCPRTPTPRPSRAASLVPPLQQYQLRHWQGVCRAWSCLGGSAQVSRAWKLLAHTSTAPLASSPQEVHPWSREGPLSLRVSSPPDHSLRPL